MKAYATYLGLQAELRQRDLLDEARRRRTAAPVRRRRLRLLGLPIPFLRRNA